MEAWLKGINCTLFAYGISGSGKTHTMEGKPEQPGVLPRVVEELFSKIAGIDDSKVLVEFSAVQVYLEKVHDLLSKAQEVKIRVLKDEVILDQPF